MLFREPLLFDKATTKHSSGRAVTDYATDQRHEPLRAIRQRLR